MFRLLTFSRLFAPRRRALKQRKMLTPKRLFWWRLAGLAMGMAGLRAMPAQAVILWNDPDSTLAHGTGAGTDILAGAVKRDDSANDTLYFKFHVEPLSDMDTEEYFAAFELFDGDVERLAIGNALKAWAYSAFNRGDETNDANSVGDYIDLHSAKPEPSTGAASSSYQYPRRGVGATLVFKIQYVPGEDDLVTVWLNPDLGPGANEAYQPESLTTRFNANGSFDEIRLRHGGGGGGWIFSDLAIATSFTDFVDVSSAQPNEAALGAIGGARAIHFQSWQKEQGLPSGPVRALAQTGEGYLWLGGEDGLIRFDGLRFVAFGAQEGIKTGPVNMLFEDHLGALWIGGAESGLSCWRSNQLVTLTTRDGLPANAVTALAEDAAGRLWIGTEAGLMGWQDGRLMALKAAKGFTGQRITALLKDRRGEMWVGVKGAGVFRYRDDGFVPLAGEAAEELLKDSHCLLTDQAGRIWIGAGEDYVLCLEGTRWHHYRIPHNLVKAHISALAEEPDGTVWAGSTGGGLISFKDGKSVALPPNSGLAGSQIEALLTDREGELWLGTEGGLNRLRRKDLFTLSQSEGLGFGAAQSLAEVMPGVVWVAKSNGGLYRWDGKSFSRLSAAGLSPHDPQITALLVARNGFCWVATTNRLLLYKDPIAAADEVTVIKPAEPNIITLAEDREGAVWIGTRDGKLCELRQDQWVPHTNLPMSAAVTAIVPDPDGSLWVGTDGSGIYRLKNGSVQHLDKREGLTSEAIRTLHLDAQGALWIGTADEGLSRWRNGRIAHFTARGGLPDHNVTQILEDDAGRLWLGSGGGIACVNKLRLEELAAGKILAVYPHLLRRAEGMLSEECTGGFHPAGLKTKSGLLWFSTLKGVAVVNPRVLPTATVMPNTVLEEVLVDGTPNPMFHRRVPGTAAGREPAANQQSQPARLRITPGTHRVEFRYTGLGFAAPERIRFRYRLEGLDSDWTEAGTRRTAFYSYLPPGDYRFRVAACNGDGIWSDAESGLALVVLRHFWQTGWFLTLAGLSLLISVAGAVRLVEKRKLHFRLQRLEQERALERERTRIAQDLHDEMGAKLCRISFLSEHARRGALADGEMQEHITSISNASREVLRSLDEIVWAVNPKNDTLENAASYLGQYAEEYFQMTGVQCELDIPTEVPPHPLSSQIRHHLFLATHEALTNILKHSNATQARISMVFGHAGFAITISDNGGGFNSSRFEAPDAAAAGDGLGNMCQRLADIGGHCRIASAPGRGTTIRFEIPLPGSPKDPL